MTLSKTKPKGNSLSGTLTGATYLGTDNQYAVELTDDLSLNVRHQNRTDVGDRHDNRRTGPYQHR